jgi:hypothetical protein
MTNQMIKEKLQNLPDNLKEEIFDFIDFIYSRFRDKNVPKSSRRPGYGILKGKISMKDDFDDPLEDFKEVHVI